MRKLSLLFLWVISFKVCAQQNLFNVPSSEITIKKGVFFQQQLNISQIIQSNTNFCYGLGRNFEIGFNVVGLQSKDFFRNIIVNDSLDDEPLAPLGLLTMQKGYYSRGKLIDYQKVIKYKNVLLILN